jgi:DNA-binding MarR family transcriptional regulator
MVAMATLASPTTNSPEVLRLVDLVHDVMRASLRQLAPTLADEGITMGQFWALKTVSSLESASLGTVARYLGISPPSACANVDQLEAAGLVRRHRSEKDRRTVQLSLTPKGRRVMARVWEQIAEVMAGAARELPRNDIAAAVRTFQALSTQLSAGTASREVAA